MPREWVKLIKLFLIPAIFLMAMAGGHDKIAPNVSDAYALESVSAADGGQSSRVYRAENKTVPEVAQELIEQEKPEEMSEENPQHMFLVYSDAWYHLQQDTDKPTDTLIQVDTKEFVKENYESSFLKAYFVASVLSDILDGMSDNGGSYRGYSSKDVNKPGGKYSTPDKAAPPPVTKEGTGTIIKRGQKSETGTVGSSGSLFEKPASSSSQSTGKIIRDSSGSSSSNKGSSIFSPSQKSPPKTKVGGSGRITKRR